MPELTCRLIPVASIPGTAVVSLRGSIDPRNLMGLQVALNGERGRCFRTLVFDLGEIRYINSAGLAFLVNLSDQLEARGGGLHLANSQPKVKLVFELMGLTELFKIYKTVDSALSAVLKVRPSSSPALSRTSRRA
jgi:stage II sporulation protein AA (anti-sigma F factor antagonist)